MFECYVMSRSKVIQLRNIMRSAIFEGQHCMWTLKTDAQPHLQGYGPLLKVKYSNIHMKIYTENDLACSY